VVKKSTNGQGVQAVYDAVGVTTWEGSLDCLAPRGYMLAYGQSAGPVPPFTLDILRQKTIFVTRPGGGSYPNDPAALEKRRTDLFNWLQSGELKVHVHGKYLLKDAAEAHRALEGRATIG
jgi:NADPH2:quinone reductase